MARHKKEEEEEEEALLVRVRVREAVPERAEGVEGAEQAVCLLALRIQVALRP